MNRKHGISVASFAGGNLRNAIAREASAVMVFEEALKEPVRVAFNIYAAEMERVWKITEPGIALELESEEVPSGRHWMRRPRRSCWMRCTPVRTGCLP